MARRAFAMKAPRASKPWRARVQVALAALALVLANAPKPLVIDDPVYVALAHQIRVDPSDPYGFEMLWNEVPEPAFQILAPPLLPYWIAGSMALFGDQPVRWKLALLPFALALAASLRGLLARFAPGLETPLLWMAVCAPPLLPALNLMLDVPSLALALSGLLLFLRACERESLGAAVLAGIVAGLAMQTKYTAATSLGAMLAWGLLAGRMRLALAAVAVAASVFAGWEGLMALRYGRSHLAQGLLGMGPFQYPGSRAEAALGWSVGFVSLLGALAPAVGVLGLAALGARERLVTGVALAVAGCFAAIALLPSPGLLPTLEPFRLDDPPPELLLFASLGLGVAASVGAAAARRLRSAPAREDLFLAAWLAIEIAGFAILSPYPAARRVLGVSTVALLLCGRAARCTLGAERARRAVRAPLALGLALAALYAASDLADALAGREAVRVAERAIRSQDGPGAGTVWYVGHWGFQFYAERAGMKPVAPGISQLRRGDWLVVPAGVHQQSMRAVGVSPPLARTRVRSASPWSTQPWLYAGAFPIRPRTRALVRVTVHRVLEDFVPEPPAAPHR